MSVPSQRVILCEGFDDRAFWKGLLEEAGATSLGGPGQDPPMDPFDKQVRGGAFAFRLPGGQFLRLQPAHGAHSVLKTQASFLGKNTFPCDILVVNIDLDATHAEPAHLASALQSRLHAIRDRLQAIRDRLPASSPEADLAGPGPWTVAGTRVFPVIWRAARRTRRIGGRRPWPWPTSPSGMPSLAPTSSTRPSGGISTSRPP